MFVRELAVEPVSGSPFESIVATTNWHEETVPERLRVASELGWLATVGDNGTIDSLVGFSVEGTEHENAGVLLPPKDIDEVKARLVHATGRWVNTDMTAKGLGSTVAVAPDALQPDRNQESEVAVRSIAVGPDTEIHMRAESDTRLGRYLRLARHLSLFALPTTTAIRLMEKNYGDARLVHMPAPPIWLAQQRRA